MSVKAYCYVDASEGANVAVLEWCDSHGFTPVIVDSSTDSVEGRPGLARILRVVQNGPRVPVAIGAGALPSALASLILPFIRANRRRVFVGGAS